MGQAWWMAVLRCSPRIAESWVMASPDGGVVAVCVLVIDEVDWKLQRRSRRGPWTVRCFSAVLCPILALRAFAARPGGMKSGSTPPVGVRNRTWLEMLAVSPDRQGRGLAKRLLDLCEDRTMKMGRRGICLRVETQNVRARRLYEKRGFLSYAEDETAAYYAKFLSVSEAVQGG